MFNNDPSLFKAPFSQRFICGDSAAVPVCESVTPLEVVIVIEHSGRAYAEGRLLFFVSSVEHLVRQYKSSHISTSVVVNMRRTKTLDQYISK